MILDRFYKLLLLVITVVFIAVLLSDILTLGIQIVRLCITKETNFAFWSSFGFQIFKIIWDTVVAGLLIFVFRAFKSFDQFTEDR